MCVWLLSFELIRKGGGGGGASGLPVNSSLYVSLSIISAQTADTGDEKGYVQYICLYQYLTKFTICDFTVFLSDKLKSLFLYLFFILKLHPRLSLSVSEKLFTSWMNYTRWTFSSLPCDFVSQLNCVREHDSDINSFLLGFWDFSMQKSCISC